MTDNLTVLPKNLSNQNILITGAAGRIGSAIAKHALSSGAKVLLADVNAESLEKLLLSLASFDSNSIYSFVSDLSNSQGIDQLISSACDSVGHLDSAIHCAYPRSSGWGAKFEDVQQDDIPMI